MKLYQLLESTTVFEGDLSFDKESPIDSFYDIPKRYKPFHDYIPGGKFKGHLIVKRLPLESLKGAPSEINGNFVVVGSKIKNLIGAPKIIHNGIIDVSYTETLTSLKGLPKRFGLIRMIECPNIKSLLPLWDSDFKSIAYNPIMNDKLKTALDIFMNHRKNKEKNFFKVIKDARDAGVEEYFK